MFWASDNLEEFMGEVHAFTLEVGRSCAKGVEKAVEAAEREAKATHRFQNRTHTLEGSIEGTVTKRDERGADGKIVAEANYASYVNDGTPPHQIAARRKKALHWDDRFARVVQHPGTKPDGFMDRAERKAQAVLNVTVVAAIDAATRRFDR